MSGTPQYDEHLLKNDDLSENASEYSESDVCSSITSESATDDDYEPAWIEKVGIKGELFYVEPTEQAISVKDDRNEFSSVAKYSIENHNFKFPLSEEKTSATERLRVWMKQRREKLKQKHRDAVLADNRSFPPEDKLSLRTEFQDSVCSNVSEVCLDVDPCKNNYGRRASLCESLLGIIIGPFNQHMDSVPGMLQPFTIMGKVMVHGLTPDSEASKSNDIKVGDWLKTIDGVDVNRDNINSVLATMVTPRKVTVILQRFTEQRTPPAVSQNDSHSLCSLIKQLIGDSQTLENAKSDYLHIPHAVFYLTISSESDDEGDDVCYKYPDQETPLYLQKGMFITLCHTIGDFASSPPLCSSLIVKEELVHTGYVTAGKEVMVLALPSACASIAEVQHFTANIEKVLKLQFCTLNRAFSEADNKEYLDHLFALFFHNILSPLSGIHSKPAEPHMMEVLPSVHWLPVPDNLKIHVDDALNELESGDFYDMDDYDAQRLYSILGSCYFYKGYLLDSHHHKDDLLDIHLYLRHHHLLELTKREPVSQAIVWKEVFLTRHHQEKTEPTEPGYEETDGRHFFLIVAMQYSILGVILEAGGCAQIAEGYPPPNPYYVDQARNVLLRLESSGILSAIDTIIECPVPPLASPDSFLKEERSTWNALSTFISRNLNLQLPPQNSALGRRSLSHSNLNMESISFSNSVGGRRMQEVASILKKHVDIDGEKQQLLSNMGPADGESDTNLSQSASDETTPRQGRKHSRSLSLSTSSNTESQESYEHTSFQSYLPKRTFASTYDLSYIQKTQDDCDLGNNDDIQKLVVGSENTLFHYLHMDPVEGIFLAPTEHASDWLKGSNHKELIDTFYNCCLKMRSVFERSLRNKELTQNGMIPKFGVNNFLQAVYEQGVFFQYCPTDGKNSKKLPPSLNFWVIGRLFFAPEPREVYVCLHDSAQQNIVELAFRLGFGLLL